MKVKLLKKVENIVAKGDIAHIEQFLLLSEYFKKSSAAEASKSVCIWEKVKFNFQYLPFLTYNKFAADCFEKCQGNNVENLYQWKYSY